MINTVTVKDVKLKLGELCKHNRQRYDITQGELAEALGLSRFTIQKFESGKNATLDTTLKIAYHFDLLKPFHEALKQHLEDEQNIPSMY